MSRKQRPPDAAQRRKAELRKAGWHKLIEKGSRLLSRERVPRDPTEALTWLKQFASELLDVQKKMHEAFRPGAKTARHAVPQWIEPWILSPHLVKWFTGAVKAYNPEEPTKGKRRARSMEAALGLIRPSGRPRDIQGKQSKLAIQIDDLREVEGLSWYKIAERLQINDDRTARQIRDANADAVIKHRISRVRLVPRGYDLKDGKLIINKREAATVRMIFERYAQLGSAPAPKRALAALMRKLRAEGITDERGKPIDKAYLYRLLNNRVYVSEVVRKGMYRGKHEAIVDRALWLKVHRVRRALTAVRRRKGREGGQ